MTVAGNITPRVVAGLVWRQTRPSSALLDFDDPARYAAPFNQVGEPGVLYTCLTTERGAWAELFRHWEQDDISPFEVRRRVGRAKVSGLAVLDLTDPDVARQIGITDDELVADDCTACQRVATEARNAGFDGILAPSAALRGVGTSRPSRSPSVWKSGGARATI